MTVASFGFAVRFPMVAGFAPRFPMVVVVAPVITFLGFLYALGPSFFSALNLGAGFGFLFFAHVVPTLFHPRAERRMTV